MERQNALDDVAFGRSVLFDTVPLFPQIPKSETYDKMCVRQRYNHSFRAVLRLDREHKNEAECVGLQQPALQHQRADMPALQLFVGTSVYSRQRYFKAAATQKVKAVILQTALLFR